jgi:hypothetical protein
MLVLVIVLLAVVVLALLIGFGGFAGPRGYGAGYDAPVHRRIIYRRPARRIITEHRIVDDGAVDPSAGVDPVDGPVYRP